VTKKIRYKMMLTGIMILGLSISFLRYGAVGTDPYTTMNLGVSSTLGLSFGTYQLLINTLLLAVIFVYKRRSIGIGTVMNMIMVGFTSDFFYFLLTKMLPSQQELLLRASVTVLAVGLACTGIALYMEADLGIAPYDALSILIVDKSSGRVPFFMARMIIDILAVFIGFRFGAVVGIGTVILSLFTGPLVQIIREKLLSPNQNKDTTVVKV